MNSKHLLVRKGKLASGEAGEKKTKKKQETKRKLKRAQKRGTDEKWNPKALKVY